MSYLANYICPSGNLRLHYVTSNYSISIFKYILIVEFITLLILIIQNTLHGASNAPSDLTSVTYYIFYVHTQNEFYPCYYIVYVS